MLTEFLTKIKKGEAVSFQQTQEVIKACYDYTPALFYNGLEEDRVCNEAGCNEGSCKLFYFAMLHELTEAETLGLFGDYYRVDVLQHPEAKDHANIRAFMKYGWAGIFYQDKPLALKS